MLQGNLLPNQWKNWAGLTCASVVQVFDPYAGNKDERLVRQLKGHERPVHTTRFAPSKFHVLSGSDDATVGFSVSEGSNAPLGSLCSHSWNTSLCFQALP